MEGRIKEKLKDYYFALEVEGVKKFYEVPRAITERGARKRLIMSLFEEAVIPYEKTDYERQKTKEINYLLEELAEYEENISNLVEDEQEREDNVKRIMDKTIEEMIERNLIEDMNEFVDRVDNFNKRNNNK